MSRFLFWVFLIVAFILFIRQFKFAAKKETRRAQRKQQELKTGAQGTLVKDPKTGEYHVEP